MKISTSFGIVVLAGLAACVPPPPPDPPGSVSFQEAVASRRGAFTRDPRLSGVGTAAQWAIYDELRRIREMMEEDRRESE